MWHELRLFLAALQSLTRWPGVSGRVPQPEWLNQSARHVPGVGLVVGGVAAAVLWASAHAWPAMVAVLMSMVATAWLTRALHEDGLAATCGAVALLLGLAVKAAALHGLATRDLLAALAVLPLAHGVSRATPVVLLYLLPSVGDAQQVLARSLARRIDGLGLVVALLWVAVMVAATAVFLSPTALFAALLAAATVTLAMAQWLHRHLGGHTGPALGAAQQFSELAIYLAVLAAQAGA